jgi:lysophospholipase L1-like esterase
MYDSSMTYLGTISSLAAFDWNISITMPADCYYVRFLLADAYAATAYWGLAADYGGFLSGHSCKLKNVVPLLPEAIVDAYLPSELYCAVGRTIELYNNQVCLQADKYHMQWVCTVGRPMKRKFVIEGLTPLIGNYTLTLNIYDDNLNVVWTGSTTVKIVDAAISGSYTYCALGDSLSSLKLWLAEVQRLSAGHLTQIGKIPFSIVNPIDSVTYTGQCDGRGGFSAASYLAATASDNTSTGGIAEEVHAFWNPTSSRFDWAYYKTNVAVSPSFVQIFLGTNGASLDATVNATNIKAIIDYIRQDDADIPIYVVNTLYRGNQDGIGMQGNNEGYTASIGAWKYNEDKKMFNLMVKLDELLSDYTSLYFVPVALTHDSENNFGTVETPVNPRATQTELLPEESIHPKAQGYNQMADIMFSTFAGTLS